MTQDDHNDSRTPDPVGIGIGFVVGTTIGAVLFAITQNPVWVGLGSGLGLMGGVIYGYLTGRGA